MKRPQLSWKQRISQRISHALGLPSLAADSRDSLALQMLAPFSNLYLPWSTFALRPSAMVSVLNEIQVNRKTCIVECGAGISTMYIAKMLQQNQAGHLYSIEHDSNWLAQVQTLISGQGLSSYVTLIAAPLTPCSFALNHNLWYDTEPIYAALTGQTIDLLLIDGPPAYERNRELARYPALPCLHSLLSQTVTIILDDIERAGEQAIVQKWEQQFGMEFEDYGDRGGIAMARLAGADSYVAI